MAYDPFDGPIPGANYTSDTKNYPWHRPPQYTEWDEALEFVMTSVTDKKAANSIMGFFDLGATVADITDMIITAGIGGGRWSPDFGILLAGPISHIILILARGYDVEFEMGLDVDFGPTPSFFQSINEDRDMEEVEETDDMQEGAGEAAPSEGFLGGAPAGPDAAEQAPEVM